VSFATAKSVKGVLTQTDGVKSTKDASIKLNKDNSIGTLSLTGAALGKYRLNLTIDGVTLTSPVFTVVESLKIRSASYQVTQSLKFPTSLDQTITPNEQVKEIKKAQDDYFLHFAVAADFTKSQDTVKPSQVYLTVRKSGEKDQLSYTRYGKLNPSTGLYQITLDFSRDMEHLNGDYDLSLHASDYRAEKSISWSLGKVSIWFKQGLDQGSNQGVKEEYRAGDVIEHYFPPQAPEKNLVVIFIVLLTFSSFPLSQLHS